jgi:aminopeptidase N
MSSTLRDKSLLQEGAVAGWWRARRRPFAEPGAQPHYGRDRAFELARIDVELRLDPAKPGLVGRAEIHVGATSGGLGPVVLDLDEVTVDGVSWVGHPEHETVWRHDDGTLRVVPPEALLDGTIEVRWHGTPRRGLYFVGPTPAYPDRPWEAWSQCQDEDAHFFLPCFDHPSVKHAWSFKIEAPSDYTVVCNGKLVEQSTDGEWQTWHWVQRDPVPAYLVTIVVARLETHETTCGDLPVRYLVPAGTDAATVERVFGPTPEMIRCLERFYGVAYPWSRYDQVVVHEFIFGGMENTGATTMTNLILVSEQAALDYDAHGLVLHELAHQWFGDLVTCQDWSQGWLNEGWATYSEALWQEDQRGVEHAAWYTWRLARAYMDEASARYQRPIVSYRFREPIDMFDRHLYEKGACVLHTLRHELGEAAFWPAVTSYLKRHAHGTVHTRHFQRAIEDATGRNLDGFFQQWVLSAGHPELTVSLQHDNGLLQVKVSQTQSGDGVPEAFSLGLRVQVIAETGDLQTVDLPIRERSQTFHLPCEPAPLTVRIDPGFRVLARLRLEAPGSWLRRLLVQDACPVLRIRAAESLARNPDAAALDALCAALTQDASWTVRAELARVLGEVGGPAAQKALLSALDSEPEARARRPVVAVLAGFRNAEVAERLTQLIATGDPSNYVLGAAGVALGRMRAKQARKANETLIGQPSWGDILVSRGLQGLGLTRDPTVLPVLLDWTVDTHPNRSRAAACGALATLAEALPDVRTQVVERLSELAVHGPFRVQLAAVAGLGRMVDTRGSGALRKLLDGAGDGRVRRMAYESLRNIQDGRDAETAVQGLRDDMETLRKAHGRLQERLARLEPIGDAK